MFWKLFWLMLRGKGNTRILFDSEAVQFKAHMIEVTKAHFNPEEEGGGLGEYLSLHWDANIDQYLRVIGDIDDLQSVIKHINDDGDEISDEDFAQLKAEAEKHENILDKLVKASDKDEQDPLDTLDAHMIESVKFDAKKYMGDIIHSEEYERLEKRFEQELRVGNKLAKLVLKQHEQLEKTRLELEALEDSILDRYEEDTDFAKAFEELMKEPKEEPPIKYIYKNWKGEVGVRTIYPLDISYGSNEYHTTPTYLLRAWDLDKKAIRTFDMSELIPYKDEIKQEIKERG